MPACHSRDVSFALLRRARGIPLFKRSGFSALGTVLCRIGRSSGIFLLILILCPPFFSTARAGEVPERIISLAPSITEILFALGLDDRIAGVSSFCDYPEAAKTKPRIGGMSNPSLEAVVRLHPDIVVLTTDGNPKEFEERLRTLNIPTHVFMARRIGELPGGIREVGYALGVGERAEILAGSIEQALKRFSKNRNSLRQMHRKKRVLFIIWPEPFVVAGPGTAIDDAITLLGAENIASKAKSAYPKYSIEEVIHQSPDAIFIGRMRENMREASKGLLERIPMIPAVRNGAVFFVSDSLYRLGPRVISGIEELEKHLK